MLPSCYHFYVFSGFRGCSKRFVYEGLERVQNKSLGCNRLRYRKNAYQRVPTTNCVGYNPTLSAISFFSMGWHAFLKLFRKKSSKPASSRGVGTRDRAGHFATGLGHFPGALGRLRLLAANYAANFHAEVPLRSSARNSAGRSRLACGSACCTPATARSCA